MIISPEQLAGLPAVADVRDKPRYHADKVILWYRRRGFSELMRDLGIDAEAVTIQGTRETVTFTAADEPVIVPMPGLMAQAVSLARAATGVLKVVAPEVAAARLAACDGCDLLDRERMRCRSCGCFVKAKAQMSGERCPVGKWDAPVGAPADAPGTVGEKI